MGLSYTYVGVASFPTFDHEWKVASIQAGLCLSRAQADDSLVDLRRLRL